MFRGADLKVDDEKYKSIVRQVLLDDLEKQLLSEIKKLPPEHKNDLLYFFAQDKLDFSRFEDFQLEVENKFRIAKCQCTPERFFHAIFNIIGDSITQRHDKPFFADRSLFDQVNKIKQKVEEIIFQKQAVAPERLRL